MAKTELVVALDFTSVQKAETLLEELSGLPVIYKVGLELFLSAGPAWVHCLSQIGHRVFLDLKFHDIPTTVGQAIVKAAELNPEFLSIHLSGGSDMLEEISLRLKDAVLVNQIKKKPKVIGIGVLSSFHLDDWTKTFQKLTSEGALKQIEDSVLEFSSLAAENSTVNGLVCSPHELAAIHAKHPELFLMVSGIRPVGCFRHDQQWTMTPGEAVANGASAIIVGRPISQAENSREMTESILAEIAAKIAEAA